MNEEELGACPASPATASAPPSGVKPASGLEQSRSPTGAEIADILDKAADRLSKPGAWTKGHLARASNGRPVGPQEDAAVCWCMSGAIIREAGAYDLESKALSAASGVIPDCIPDWNDRRGRTQRQVVAKLREAAAKAREQSA